MLRGVVTRDLFAFVEAHHVGRGAVREVDRRVAEVERPVVSIAHQSRGERGVEADLGIVKVKFVVRDVAVRNHVPVAEKGDPRVRVDGRQRESRVEENPSWVRTLERKTFASDVRLDFKIGFRGGIKTLGADFLANGAFAVPSTARELQRKTVEQHVAHRLLKVVSVTVLIGHHLDALREHIAA